MKLERKAKKYAGALLSTAKKIDSINEVNEALKQVVHLLKRESTFRSFFQTRRIEPDKKRQILERILGENSHRIVSEFFGLLAAKREHQLFVQTAWLFEKLRKKELDILPVAVFTPEKMEVDESERIRSVLSGLTKKQVEFDLVVDPDLIGGVRLRMGNLFVDGSIKGNLERLRGELIQG